MPFDNPSTAGVQIADELKPGLNFILNQNVSGANHEHSQQNQPIPVFVSPVNINHPIHSFLPPNMNNAICPPGLEYLAELDQVIIKQETKVLEIMIDWECTNKYKIFNSVGQQCYLALEESNICARQCCKLARPLTMHITDNFGNDVFLVERPYRCACCTFTACCFLCKESVTVRDRGGNILGTATQKCSIIKPHFTINDGNDEPALELWGPCIKSSCCGSSVSFSVIDAATGNEVGQVRKMWTGIAKELMTDSDNFGVTFPIHMDPKLKATLVGLVFLLDLMYFEDEEKGIISELT